MLVIEHLGEHKEYIEDVIQLICKEFGYEDNYDFWESIVKHSLEKDKIGFELMEVRKELQRIYENNSIIGN